MEADTRARHRADQKIADARLRLIRELERITYSDVRDVAQWDREAELDRAGNVVGFKDVVKVRPSHLLAWEKLQGKPGQIAGRLAHSDLVILDELGYLPFQRLWRSAALSSTQQTLRANQRRHHHELELRSYRAR